MKKFQIKSRIVKNTRVRDRYFKMVLAMPGIAKVARPGQFVNIKVSANAEPFLRRPFSVHRVTGSNIEILYEVLGRGTEALAQRKPGELIDVIGPLGNGFDYKAQGTRQKAQILVAGGMGVAPMIFLTEKLMEIPNPKFQIPNIVLIGAKTKSQILGENEFKKLGCAVKIATDDGSRGFRGKVTALLSNLLRVTSYAMPAGRQELRVTIYACGPRPMLKEISRISKECHIPSQILLEEHLACGIGACLGCVVKTRQGYARVCQDGPVFNAEEIIW